MPNDQPIAYTADNRPLYDNTPTVVCLILQNSKGEILTVRRANDPGRGLLGLPGGYHMRGETWQEAGFREVLEETGIKIALLPGHIRHPLSLVTDEYGNNLVIAAVPALIDEVGTPQDGEALEIVWVNMMRSRPVEWAFPQHYGAALHYHIHHSIKE